MKTTTGSCPVVRGFEEKDLHYRLLTDFKQMIILFSSKYTTLSKMKSSSTLPHFHTLMTTKLSSPTPPLVKALPTLSRKDQR
jgi:hypothetical protein